MGEAGGEGEVHGSTRACRLHALHHCLRFGDIDAQRLLTMYSEACGYCLLQLVQVIGRRRGHMHHVAGGNQRFDTVERRGVGKVLTVPCHRLDTGIPGTSRNQNARVMGTGNAQ